MIRSWELAQFLWEKSC